MEAELNSTQQLVSPLVGIFPKMAKKKRKENQLIQCVFSTICLFMACVALMMTLGQFQFQKIVLCCFNAT